MKLAEIIYRDDIPWLEGEIEINPPVGTIVQYKQSVDGGYDVYFPGVRWFAPMSDIVFYKYFEDLDDETS